MTKKEKCEYAHLQFQTRCVEKGVIVSKPIMEMRYDFIIDDHGVLKRVQVKFCDTHPSTSAISYQVSLQTRWNKGPIYRYTAKEIDLVMVWIHKEKVIICLTPDLFEGKSGLVVRSVVSKNNQISGTHMIKDLVW
jgi:hypothetical protein